MVYAQSCLPATHTACGGWEERSGAVQCVGAGVLSPVISADTQQQLVQVPAPLNTSQRNSKRYTFLSEWANGSKPCHALWHARSWCWPRRTGPCDSLSDLTETNICAVVSYPLGLLWPKYWLSTFPLFFYFFICWMYSFKGFWPNQQVLGAFQCFNVGQCFDQG